MDTHGFDHLTIDAHAMYSPDSHASGSDVGAPGARQDDGLDTDESPGGPEASATPASPETVHVDVNGRVTDVNATVDSDHDGRADTAIIRSGVGHRVTVTDTDHDGVADRALLVDDQGRVVDSATFDRSTGRWHDTGAGTTSVDATGAQVAGGARSTTGTGAGTGPDVGADTATAAAGWGPSRGQDAPITVDAGGRTSTVAATVDVDHDGANETAVVRGVDGTRVTFSDTDGDGEADRATVIDPQGNVVGTARFDPVTGDWHDDPHG